MSPGQFLSVPLGWSITQTVPVNYFPRDTQRNALASEGKRRCQISRFSVAVCVLFALCQAAVAGTYNVNLDTTALVGNSSGPFSVQLVFTDGSGVGDANNLVAVGNVQFGGGMALGNPFVFGGAAGSLETGITVTDSSFFNYFLEGFSAGNQLDFTLTLTSNDDLTGTPDRLVFYLILTPLGIPSRP